MNGRCQKDALDRAEDICELCGDQFCASCLLFPRGHRAPPTCKTCALEHSGLRGGSNKRQAISKREYKKRKKELIAALEEVEEQQPAIEYFELNDPSKFDHSNELDRRVVVVEEEPTIDILSDSDAPPAPTPPAPNSAPIPAPLPSFAPVATPAPAPAAPLEQGVAGLAPVDTSVNPLALGGPPVAAAETTPSDASSSAAELLARLKADQPIQSQFTAAPVGLDTDPFATPTSDLVAPEQLRPATPASPTPPADVRAMVAAQPHPAQPHPAQPDPAPLQPAPLNQVPPHAAPAERAAPRTEPWSPPTPPPRGSNLSAMAAGASNVDAPGSLKQAPLAESPFGATPFDGSAPQDAGTSDDTPARRKADTDDSGQWIPPSLRGMAATDERGPLPKRRN